MRLGLKGKQVSLTRQSEKKRASWRGTVAQQRLEESLHLCEKIVSWWFREFLNWRLEYRRFVNFLVIFLNVLLLTLFLRRFFRIFGPKTASTQWSIRKRCREFLEFGEEEWSFKKIVVVDQGSCSLMASGKYSTPWVVGYYLCNLFWIYPLFVRQILRNHDRGDLRTVVP